MSLIHADSTDDGVGLANYDFLVHHYISYFLKHKYKVLSDSNLKLTFRQLQVNIGLRCSGFSSLFKLIGRHWPKIWGKCVSKKLFVNV